MVTSEEIRRLKKLSDEELQEEAARLRESLFRLNFKLALGDLSAVKAVRREKNRLGHIASILRARGAASPTVILPRARSRIGRKRIEEAVDSSLRDSGKDA